MCSEAEKGHRTSVRANSKHTERENGKLWSQSRPNSRGDQEHCRDIDVDNDEVDWKNIISIPIYKRMKKKPQRNIFHIPLSIQPSRNIESHSQSWAHTEESAINYQRPVWHGKGWKYIQRREEIFPSICLCYPPQSPSSGPETFNSCNVFPPALWFNFYVLEWMVWGVDLDTRDKNQEWNLHACESNDIFPMKFEIVVWKFM